MYDVIVSNDILLADGSLAIQHIITSSFSGKDLECLLIEFKLEEGFEIGVFRETIGKKLGTCRVSGLLLRNKETEDLKEFRVLRYFEEDNSLFVEIEETE